MKRLMMVAAFALLPTASDARMRHDRPCDIAQDKSDPEELNPDGGNANLFGLCGGIKDLRSEAADQWPGRGQWWGALNCGYYAYRQGKASRANSYYNLHLAEGWGKGWEEAHEACIAGRAPFTDTNPRLPRAFRGIWCPINGREGDGIYQRPPTKRVDIPLFNLSYDDSDYDLDSHHCIRIYGHLVTYWGRDAKMDICENLTSVTRKGDRYIARWQCGEKDAPRWNTITFRMRSDKLEIYAKDEAR